MVWIEYLIAQKIRQMLVRLAALFKAQTVEEITVPTVALKQTMTGLTKARSIRIFMTGLMERGMTMLVGPTLRGQLVMFQQTVHFHHFPGKLLILTIDLEKVLYEFCRK